MKTYFKITVLLISLMIAFGMGCSDRSSDLVSNDTFQESGYISPQRHSFFNEFLFQINNGIQNNGFQLQQYTVYTPKVSLAHIYGGSLQPVPYLILLAPEDGNEYYYINHGLKEIADELISSGTIEPMAIVTISNRNDKNFGGLFYAGHLPLGGNYDTLVGGTLIEHLEEFYPFLISSSDKRGIGGFGQGAYGAFRASILHPGVFSSLSVVDGPLDFDGANGTSGLIQFFDDAIAEQGSLSSISQFNYKDIWPVSRTFIGGSYAFSPHDTMLFTSLDDNLVDINIDSSYILTDDTTTYVKKAIQYIGYHLPFDIDGNLYSPIWDTYWMPNNLENLLTPGVLNGTDIWMATSVETDFLDYHNQTQSFINTLSAEYPIEVVNYTGYDGKPAKRGVYTYDLLRQILIFHDSNFKK